MAPTRSGGTTKKTEAKVGEEDDDKGATSGSGDAGATKTAEDAALSGFVSSSVSSLPKTAIVHPLVLLSAVDHYNRVSKETKKRVVGVLLGARKGASLDISNSFAVPFEEDERDPSVFFFDHDYVAKIFTMFKKINAKEKIVGWYHTGPKLKSNDMAIHEILQRFTPHPVLVVIDVAPKELGLPTEAYMAVEQVHADGTPTSKTFEHIPSEILAEETEEVGVEHLLRDVKDTAGGTLSEKITTQVASLRGLLSRLSDIYAYLDKVAVGQLPMNNEIVFQLQDIFNLLPNVSVEELVTALSVQTNDQMLIIYVASLVRSIIALHSLISNKITNREIEKKTEQSIARSLEDPVVPAGKTKDGPTAKA